MFSEPSVIHEESFNFHKDHEKPVENYDSQHLHYFGGIGPKSEHCQKAKAR